MTEAATKVDLLLRELERLRKAGVETISVRA